MLLLNKQINIVVKLKLKKRNPIIKKLLLLFCCLGLTASAFSMNNSSEPKKYISSKDLHKYSIKVFLENGFSFLEDRKLKAITYIKYVSIVVITSKEELDKNSFTVKVYKNSKVHPSEYSEKQPIHGIFLP